MSAMIESEAAIDPVAVIRLVRQLLPGEYVDPAESTNKEHDGDARPPIRETSQEDAGCMLWDLSTIREAASIMADNHICEVLPFIIEHGSDRLAEISTGILGNLACHDVLVQQLLTASLRQAVLGHALWRDNAACLAEVFRLSSSLVMADAAQEWLQDLLQRKSLERILWIMDNTLNNSLFERACQLLSQTASNGAAAVSAITAQPFIRILCNSLQQSVQLTAEPERGGNEWDSPSTAVNDDLFPGPQATQAMFDALEAIAEEPGGAAALEEDELLAACMLSVLQGAASLSVRGRAAALMAGLNAEAFYRSFAQDEGAMEEFISLVVRSGLDDEYGEAFWAFLAAVARYLQTAEPPLQVLREIGRRSEELVDAALQHVYMGQDRAALQRVAYALRQLAALAEQAASLPAEGQPLVAESESQMGSVLPCSTQTSPEVQHTAGEEPAAIYAEDDRHIKQQSVQQRFVEVEDFCRATAILHAAAQKMLNMQNKTEDTGVR